MEMEMLCFRLPGHGDSTLKHMNSLRSQHHFCDITIMASNNQMFRGHKVVLAACSPFLRDQFLLNPSSKLQVSVLHSATVVCDLLLSCYTGVLQFNSGEIVNYLTAASYFQMEHIVKRCRGALKKYMQPGNPSQPKVKAEESLSRAVIVSGSSHSAAAISPPVRHSSSGQGNAPLVPAQDENSTEEITQTGSQHKGGSPVQNEPSIKVNVSDEEEETRQEDYDVFRVYIPEEEHKAEIKHDENEDSGAQSDRPQGVGFPETDSGVGGVGGEDEGSFIPTEQNLGVSFLRDACTVDGLRTLRQRLSEPKVGRGRGRGRGRGFKRKKWISFQDRRPLGMPSQQDLWYLANTGMGGGFGLDYSHEGFKTGNYVPVDLPQVDFSMGEVQGDEEGTTAASSMAQYAMEESTGDAGEGGSGLGTVPTDEGGDESVAVVGSTSSVAGPVICEHCGMTFPSAHSLAIHARFTHLLYACPCCGKHFHHSANLTRHMAVHRGAGKTHQCPLCYKTFTQKSTLIDHMNLHSGERPHRCAYCNARFAHRPALRRHLKEQHGKTTGQNSLHEQQEREREQGGGAVREEGQELPVTDQIL